ncbi:MAG: hypothetical protein AVDCRST_MAG79-1982 [uncultured Thermoleophilia bacterium]|uniref:DUF429 domain-containing protein n=1 Tax=uncultured Thermoleophilia bacterium TaxID=1497501 RepID=A0A6J4U9P9_9ACTN|nr:MAG: hypothetical protein AVDCRST_MAG79-1982 [uncultured Thermoleophilia bacterium]
MVRPALGSALATADACADGDAADVGTCERLVSVLGIDAWTGGWVAVLLVDGRFADAFTAPGIGSLLDGRPDAVMVAVDIPIGFPVGPEPRAADVAARRFVGPRRSSVFMTPPRAVLEQPDYGTANACCRELTGRGLSRQSFALFRRILEVDERAAAEPRLHEVHPEASFRALAGEPLALPKRTWGGAATRRRLLARVGLEPLDDLPAVAAVPVDDVLDAAVVAWSADRIACGRAFTLPQDPPIDERGRAVAIWC